VVPVGPSRPDLLIDVRSQRLKRFEACILRHLVIDVRKDDLLQRDDLERRIQLLSLRKLDIHRNGRPDLRADQLLGHRVVRARPRVPLPLAFAHSDHISILDRVAFLLLHRREVRLHLPQCLLHVFVGHRRRRGNAHLSPSVVWNLHLRQYGEGRLEDERLRLSGGDDLQAGAGNRT